MALAEASLPAIAARLQTARPRHPKTALADLADELWQASLACFLGLWFEQSRTAMAPRFFDFTRCLPPQNRFAGVRLGQRERARLLAQPRPVKPGGSSGAADAQTVATLFEQLQEFRFLVPARGGVPTLVHDRDHRRASGSYYTPAPLVDYVVRETVGPAWRAHRKQFKCAKDVFATLATFRVVDPACGGGDFLLAAREFLVSQARSLLEDVPSRNWRTALQQRLVACGLMPANGMRLDEVDLLRLWITSNCLYGVDLDPLAVELTSARLWLQLDLEGVSAAFCDAHLCAGNALLDVTAEGSTESGSLDWLQAFPEVFPKHALGPAGFQAVIGNPPYGATRDLALRRALTRRWPQMAHNSDAVVGFVSLADHLCATHGRMGLVVPKPLTYSFAWHTLRDTLYNRIDYAIDVSRAWPEVLLEQVLLGWRPQAKGTAHFRAGEMIEGRLVNRHRAARRQSLRQRTILCGLQSHERRLFQSLDVADGSVGDICRTFRGLPLQRELCSHGDLPIIGGRDLERWGLRSKSGFLGNPSAYDLTPFCAEKLVFQNIIAHIMRPEPHIRLIGALDMSGKVTLDTVNNLIAHDATLDLRAVLALLHSRLVNWFVYAVVYNKAIRTMHFDQYFLNKIPLPGSWNRIVGRLGNLAATASAAVASGDGKTCAKAEATIDRLVARAYGVPGFADSGRA